MSKKHVSPARAVAPERIDDLKAINGIGPGVERRLNGIGIYTFAQLAALSSADIAAAVADLTGLSTERIIKQDWIGQARILAGKAEEQHGIEALSESAQEDGEQSGMLLVPLDKPLQESLEQMPQDTATVREANRSATFTVEFLIDEGDEVQRLHVVHDQSGQERTWMEWQSGQLVDFLSRCAGLHISSDQRIAEHPEAVEYMSIEGDGLHFLSLPPVKQSLAGELHLRDMETIEGESEEPRRILHHDQPFDVRLTLDLSKMTVPVNSLLRYKASIFGKSCTSRSNQFARKAEGTLLPADVVTIDLTDNILPEGTYQLAASVTIGLPSVKLAPKTGSVALIDGGIIQVV